MATVGVALCFVQASFPSGEAIPVVSSAPLDSEKITSSGASQQSTVTVTRAGLVWEISASGGAVWVAFGSNPTAAAGTAFLVPSGAIRHFSANVGDTVAVIDA